VKIKKIQCLAFYTPRVASEWVHFDLSLYDRNIVDVTKDPVGVGELVYERRSSSSTYGGNNLNNNSFRIDEVKEYILSEDKKEFRSKRPYFQEKEIESERLPMFFERDDQGQGVWVDIEIVHTCVFPVRICAHCLNISLYDLRPKPLLESRFIPNCVFQLVLCAGCNLDIKNKNRPTSVFYSDKKTKSDPRAFLYESKEKPNKSFFKKYISRHLTRVRKLRPISSHEVSFFRSWLGAKDIAALAN
jgi:hypothetical protein